jgi:hypothetical protein
MARFMRFGLKGAPMNEGVDGERVRDAWLNGWWVWENDGWEFKPSG